MAPGAEGDYGRRMRPVPGQFLVVLLLPAILAGCGRAGSPHGDGGRPPARDVGTELPVSVLADTAETGGLPPAGALARVPPARVTLVRIALARPDVEPALPVPQPSAPAADTRSPEGLAADDVLRPPIPREPLELRLPSGPPGRVDLDVRVDERGEVTDARPAGGDADSATVAAAVRAALRSRWYPATRRGRPVAVWCRQRFETGPPR